MYLLVKNFFLTFVDGNVAALFAFHVSTNFFSLSCTNQNDQY